MRDCPQESAQKSTVALDNAFKDFFRSGKGYPKPKKKSLNESIPFNGRSVSIERINAKWSRVRLPKIGWIKFRQTRPIEGKVFETTVSRTAKGWQISFGCKIDRDIADVGGAVGIDRGVVVPIQLSDGQAFAMPRSLDKLDRRQRKAQRVASRRKRGSNRHAKAQQRVRNLAAKRARIRKDWTHKATTAIAAQYGTIVIERLRTKNMTASASGTIDEPGKNVAQKRGLNRAILNVGWFQIEQMLAYKSYRLVKVNPAYSSQTCASCGAVDSKSRKNQASFVCTSCGHRDNADRNAAAVILQRGNTALLDVEGCGYAPVEASTAVMATLAA
jgi:putative transposase